ncbi:MAG: hypothetical protein M1820_010470 [Bogoriella megaspora]|nr:MAG: hypothetical protein M1820_010470 [Bogoriella megaspora]
MLFPETSSGVVVLTNSMALNDNADCIGELLAPELLGLNESNENEYIRLAQKSAQNAVILYNNMLADLELSRRKDHLPSLPPHYYVGTYINKTGTFPIEIDRLTDETGRAGGNDVRLQVSFQGRASQSYTFEHHAGDIFSWAMPFNAQIRRSRFIETNGLHYLIWFVVDSIVHKITSLVWVMDPEDPDGETFNKLEE